MYFLVSHFVPLSCMLRDDLSALLPVRFSWPVPLLHFPFPLGTLLAESGWKTAYHGVLMSSCSSHIHEWQEKWGEDDVRSQIHWIFQYGLLICQKYISKTDQTRTQVWKRLPIPKSFPLVLSSIRGNQQNKFPKPLLLRSRRIAFLQKCDGVARLLGNLSPRAEWSTQGWTKITP